MNVMKIIEIIGELKNICSKHECEAFAEFRTPTRSRIDLAIIKDKKPVLAIEFENSYKWIAQRVLYNSIKASRSGFQTVLFIYPFKKNFNNRLVNEHLKMMGVNVLFSDKDEYKKMVEELLKTINSENA